MTRSALRRHAPAGTLLHGGGRECVGLLAVQSGRLRAYILSGDGREITLYRLVSRYVCLFSAACMLRGARLDILVEAEKDAWLWVIPAAVYEDMMRASAALANYTNALMADRFSEVTWLLGQVLWSRQDRRLASFLLEERTLQGEDALAITHERIAAHLGTAREVVTRLLRYFRSEGMVRLTRGTVTLTDVGRLRALAETADGDGRGGAGETNKGER